MTLILSAPRRRAFRTQQQLVDLDARSATLLTTAGMLQPFPTTAAALLAALGSPVGWVDGDVLAIYDCSQAAGNLVDALGLGPALAPTNAPLQNRECVGLPMAGGFAAKRGVEKTADSAADAFTTLGTSFGEPAVGGALSFLIVLRTLPDTPTASNRGILSKTNTTPAWYFRFNTGAYQLNLVTSAGAYTAAVIAGANDGAWHNVAGAIDDAAKEIQLFSDVDNSLPVAYMGAAQGSNNALGLFIATGIVQGPHAQIAYLAFLGKRLTGAMRTAFWKHAQPAGLGTPDPTYTRASPLIVPISASRVACYGNNQVAVGYSAGFNDSENALKTGLVAEDAITFLGCRSTNLAGLWVGTGGGILTGAVDGPDGCRSAIRVTMPGGSGMGVLPVGPYVNDPGMPLAGATNVPFTFGGMIKRATVGQTFRASFYFSGDPGGPEAFNYAYTDGATPLDWARWSVTVTPTRPAHTGCYFVIGCTNANENVDFAEPWGVQNRSTAPLAWCRAAGVSAATALTDARVAANLFTPGRGRVSCVVSGWNEIAANQQTLWSSVPTVGNNGLMYLRHTGGNLNFQLYDAAGVFVGQFNAAKLTTAQHRVEVAYDSMAPVYRTGGVSYHVAVIVDGVVTGYGITAPWTAAAASVVGFAFGTQQGVFRAGALCMSECEIFAEPVRVP